MRFLVYFLRPVVPLVFAAGCQADAGQPRIPPRLPPDAAPVVAIDTLARIRTLVATPSCSDDSQCHTLALGASPCGGPEGYLAWSSLRTSPDEIAALGKIHEAERRSANAASGRMSTCRFTPDPGAVCREGTCALGAPAQGAATPQIR